MGNDRQTGWVDRGIETMGVAIGDAVNTPTSDHCVDRTPVKRRSKWLTGYLWGLVGVVFVIVIVTFDDYGVTWDEWVHSRYGELVIDYFKSGLQDKRCNSFLNMRYYGPLFDSATALIYDYFGTPKFETRHLCVALMALLALPGLFLYARGFNGAWVAVFGTLSLITLPRFYGHSFYNFKDIPFACFFVWSMVTVSRACARRNLAWRWVVLSGLAIGLTLSVRVGGFFLFYLLVAGRIFRQLCDRPLPWKQIIVERDIAEYLKVLALIVIAWTLMVGVWPWTHENVILNPLRSFSGLLKSAGVYPVLFEGRVVPSDQLPWHYLGKYILITTPPFHLALALLGLIMSMTCQIKNFRSDASRWCFLTQLWLLVPIVYFSLLRPNAYDGLRHFLFILPALAVFAGLGAAHVLQWASAWKKRRCVAILLFVLFLLPAKDLVRLHPYQATYFNTLVGGVGKAWQKYETDYWASSYKEAMKWVDEQGKRAGVRETTVLVAANRYSRLCAEYYVRPGISCYFPFDKAVGKPFDYYISTTRYGWHEKYPDAPVVHVVGREGAIFTVIKDFKGQ